MRETSDTPRLDAEVLLMHVCRISRSALITRGDEALSPPQLTQWRALLERRRRGEPVAYLTREREFWSMTLQVTDATLIPRPDTETLVEQALVRLPREARWSVADLGTGSGAVALAIARERPGCRLVATDVSAAALEVARTNAQRHGIGNIEFRQGSWGLPLQDERFDMIVSNPPYLRTQDAHLLRGDVRFEPRAALVAGPEGWEAIRAIARSIPACLRAGGWLLLEHGFDQGPVVREILRTEGYINLECHGDLAGHGRVSLGQRRGGPLD